MVFVEFSTNRPVKEIKTFVGQMTNTAIDFNKQIQKKEEVSEFLN